MAEQEKPGWLSRVGYAFSALAGDLGKEKRTDTQRNAGAKTPIDAAMIAAVTEQVRARISGVDASTWMSPGAPLSPQAPQASGRQWDFPVGSNLLYTPRGQERTTFQQLRTLADSYDLIRVLIETRKDQLVKMRWNIKPKDPKKKPDDRCKEIEGFFAMPDREHDWDTWLRALLEDMLVIDAATVLPQLTRGGAPYSFELLDGSTIHRLIDDGGRTPVPPEAAYQQILKGIVAADFHRDELIYAPRNVRTSKLFGYSPVEQILMTVNIAIRRQLHQLQYYSEGSTPDLIFEVPETWTPDQVKTFKEWWDSVLSGNTAGRRGTMFVPKGVTPHDTKSMALKDEYDEWLARICCFAFSISPQPFVKQMNRATAESAQEAALQEGLQPLMKWVANLVNRLIWRHWQYTDLQFDWLEEQDLDPKSQADINNVKLRNGSKTINESRADDGMDPIEGGDTPLIYTASGAVRLEDVLNPPDPVLPAAAPGEEGNAGAGKPKPKAGEGKKPDAGKLSKSKQVTPIKRDRKAVKTAITGLRKIMARLLDDQMPDIVQQLGKAIGAVGKVDQSEVDRILKSLDFEGWAVVVDDVQDVIDRITRDGGAQALLQIGIKDTDITEQVNERALAFAKDRAAELVGKKWIEGELVDNPNAKYAITESTRDLLRSTVSQAIEERWSIDELADAIAEGGAFDDKRADLIARTEVARADIQGNMTGYRESGVVEKKIWLLSNDHDIDDECNDSADQGAIDLDESFEGGDAPPAHVNCACDIAPVVSEDDTEKALMVRDMRKAHRDIVGLAKAAIEKPQLAPVIHNHVQPAPVPSIVVESPVNKIENTVHVPERELHVHMKTGTVTKTITTRRGDQGQLFADVVETTG